MKKLTSILVIVSMIVLFSAPGFAEDAANEFLETYEQTAELTYELFENVSEALSGEAMEAYTLNKKIDTLVANAETLEQLAEEMGKKEAANEAREMVFYLTRIKEALEAEEEKHALTMHLARYYLHFNNCAMVTPIVLKELLYEHVGELKEVVEKGDTHEIAHLAEHQHLHADQMYYAAMMFGRKVWQKFSDQVKVNAEEIFEAAETGDIAAVQAGVEKMEEPVNMLRKLIKK